MATIAGLLVRPSGTTFSVLLRKATLNRDGGVDPAHTLSPVGAAELRNVELQMDAERFGGDWTLGVGYDDYSRSVTADSGVRGFVRYSRGR